MSQKVGRDFRQISLSSTKEIFIWEFLIKNPLPDFECELGEEQGVRISIICTNAITVFSLEQLCFHVVKKKNNGPGTVRVLQKRSTAKRRMIRSTADNSIVSLKIAEKIQMVKRKNRYDERRHQRSRPTLCN